MKKIGIVVDDYKADGFRSAIKAAGYTFTESKIEIALKGHTIFAIMSTVQDFEANKKDIHRLCKKREIDIKLSN